MKSYGLRQDLAKVGVRSRLVVGKISWRDLPLPDRVLDLLVRDEENHVVLQVRVPEDGSIVLVDPTWDAGLSRVVDVAVWDGTRSTSLMAPMTPVVPYHLSEAALSVKPLAVRCRTAQHDPMYPFYATLDVWMDAVRNRAIDPADP